MYLLSFCPMHAKIMIMVCSITYRIFMLQICIEGRTQIECV